jgi:hypothetical protein
MSTDEIRRFSYKRTGIKIYFAFLLLAWALGFILWPILSRPRSWISLEMFFSVPGFIFLFFLFINGYFMMSDIEVSPVAISWLLFGWRWKTIKWADVDHIRISLFWDFQRHRRTKRYYLFKRGKSRPYFLPGGGMAFLETICNAEELMSVVKSQIERWGIRVEGRKND